MKINITGSCFFFVMASFALNAQDLDSLMGAMDNTEKTPEFVTATFKTTRLVNLNTIEQVKGGELDFRISHRFDDAGGAAGGISTLYGFDNVTDIRIAFDYGINDKWTVGFARSKGTYLRRQILDFNSKLRLLRQKSSGMPFSVSMYGAAELSTMKSSTDIESPVYFGKNGLHRFNFVSQLLLARKFGEKFSMELAPTVVHRNLVHYLEKNTAFSLGVGLRYKFTKRMGIILDYYHSFSKDGLPVNYIPPLGIGLEIETGGHVFHLLFSNNKSLLESQFLTQNSDDWLKGQFRFGFNISRVFNIH
ncbi:MAG TPA: DUF5777 family beta-barrel protein [Bacteroidia bacterium]|nr:DUF5777 family beta-barrel protein [Bacteroidia bacterium]